MKDQVAIPNPEGGFETFSGLIGGATKSIEKIKNRKMSEYGLTGTHTICMRRLYDSPEGLTRIELASCCAVDRAQITRVIGELLAKEFVIEIGGGAHYRKRCVLTERGREVTAEINDAVERVHRYVSGRIPKEQLSVFYETLAEICERLRSAEEML